MLRLISWKNKVKRPFSVQWQPRVQAAPMEIFWGSLKNELIHQKTYVTRQMAIDGIVEYIEIFYNRKCRYTSLGNISPAQALKKIKLKQKQLVLSGSVHFIQRGGNIMFKQLIDNLRNNLPL